MCTLQSCNYCSRTRRLAGDGSGMASKPGDEVKAAYLTFSNNAALHVLLPRSHKVDASAILRDASLDDLQRLPSRRNLFFGSPASSSNEQAVANEASGIQTREPIFSSSSRPKSSKETFNLSSRVWN